jgi:hypothetical protein
VFSADAGVLVVASVPLLLRSLLLLFPPALVSFLCFCRSAAAVDVPGIHAVSRIPRAVVVAVLTAVDVPLHPANVSNVCGIPFVAGVLVLLASLLFHVFPVACVPRFWREETMLLLAYRDAPVLSRAVVIPAVSVVLSDIDVEPQLWLESLPLSPPRLMFLTSLLFLSYRLLLASLLLLTYLLLMVFPPMLASSYVPGVSDADFGPTLPVILSAVVSSLETLLWLESFLLLLSLLLLSSFLLLMLLTFLGSRSCRRTCCCWRTCCCQRSFCC